MDNKQMKSPSSLCLPNAFTIPTMKWTVEDMAEARQFLFLLQTKLEDATKAFTAALNNRPQVLPLADGVLNELRFASPKQRQVIEHLAKNPGATPADIAKATFVAQSKISELRKGWNRKAKKHSIELFITVPDSKRRMFLATTAPPPKIFEEPIQQSSDHVLENAVMPVLRSKGATYAKVGMALLEARGQFMLASAVAKRTGLTVGCVRSLVCSMRKMPELEGVAVINAVPGQGYMLSVAAKESTTSIREEVNGVTVRFFNSVGSAINAANRATSIKAIVHSAVYVGSGTEELASSPNGWLVRCGTDLFDLNGKLPPETSKQLLAIAKEPKP
jgi:hypothetical protein